MTVTTVTLSELVAGAREGDLGAFAELVERFQPMALGYASSLLGDSGMAEDACQEAFLDAFLHLRRLREPAALAAWFRRVLVKHADRQRRRRLLYQELADVPGATDPLAGLIAAEERREVRQRVADLPPRLRECVSGFYGAGYSVLEIAAFLDVSESAVKKRLFDARNQLRRRLPEPAGPSAGPRDAVELLLAVRRGDLRRVAGVLSRRPDLVNVEERWSDLADLGGNGLGAGFTALQRAVFMGHHDVVRVLLDAGASQVAGPWLRPLDLAALQNDAAMVELLVERRAPAARPGELGPLHRAAMRGHLSAARRLLELGVPADPTAVAWARLKGHHTLADLIEEFMP